MADRILDITESPAQLRVRYEQLLVQRGALRTESIPLGDLAVVIVGHPQIIVTQAVLAGLARHGAALIACDERRLPVLLALPLEGHFTQAERFAAQAAASLPLRKRLWRQVVRAKIAAQADLLEKRHGSDHGLRALIPLVRSGDPTNVEARAASRYWDRLFGSIPFRRVRDGDDQNRLLNYGYAVLRAIVARAICAAGLHPCLGIHHHNRYNPYCLADDLMEPFRPVVDEVVAARFAGADSEAELVPEVKAALLMALLGRFDWDGTSRTLFDVLGRVCQSLAEAFENKSGRLLLPSRVIDATA